MGRDIVAFVRGSSRWHNYQCKHYSAPITPSDVYVEFGKLLYFSFQGAYEYPERYFFIAPRGVGTKLDALISKPQDLRAAVFSKWDQYCRGKITSTQDVPLDGNFRKYAESADFSIFSSVPPIKMIEQHRATPYYVPRFGGGLPQRPAISPPPPNLGPNEVVYTSELLNAYSDDLGTKVADIQVLRKHTNYSDHFDRSRQAFFSAESLRNFSRDNLPVQSYTELQEDIFEGVVDVVKGEHSSGYKRCTAVTQASKCLQISHALVSRMKQLDRSGVCHQLVEEGRFKWVL
ncbi:MAG: ABC-three component system protein [Vulcanimicrobiota bacterium]